MRVTVDLDTLKRKRLGKVFRRLIKLTGKVPEVRRSSGGKGYHLVVRGLKISYLESIWIRYRCGDDMRRIMFDTEAVKKPKQILWFAKEVVLGEHAGKKGFSEVVKYGDVIKGKSP